MAHPSTDVGSAAERVEHVIELKPQICTLDTTTMNLEGGIAGAPDCIFMNTPGMLRDMTELIRKAGTKPEIEAFNPGDSLPANAIWSAFGISRWQMEMVALSTILGGRCRVGLEDNIYLERGVFATNGQLVERASRIIRDLGCEVATPAEAREILGVA